MTRIEAIKSDLLALCATVGTVAQEGELTKASPAWVLRAMDGQLTELWLMVWVESDKGVSSDTEESAEDPRPATIHVGCLLCPLPRREVAPQVRTWMHVRNVQHRPVRIEVRAIRQSMDKPRVPNLWASSSVAVDGPVADQGPKVVDLVEKFETIAKEARFRVRQGELARAASRMAERRQAPPTSTPAEIAAVMAELDAMTGLADVKEFVRGLIDQHRFTALRAIRGLRNAPMSPNLVFTGNPGTGKTTVARILGRAYKAIGLLPKGHLVEVDRSGLVAKYVGQTALKTKAICEQALGGVLFIDEAYSLDRESPVDFGAEAVEAIMTFMESHRGELAVVVAGYPHEMASFMAMNPGLRSRFDTFVHFPDFDTADLITILVNMFREHDYVILGEARERLEALVASIPRGPGFGNARDMRNLFGDIVRRHAQRTMSAGGQIKPVHLSVIHPMSIPDPVEAAHQAPAPAAGVYL